MVVEALVPLEVVHHPREQHQVVEPLCHWVLLARREDARARVVGVVAPPGGGLGVQKERRFQEEGLRRFSVQEAGMVAPHGRA